MLYLTSDEYKNLQGPFLCEPIFNEYVNKRQVLIVKIHPSLSGVDYNRGFCPINYLLLIAKYKDKAIKELNKFPIDVIVFLPDVPDNPFIIKKRWSEMDSIAWAKLIDQL